MDKNHFINLLTQDLETGKNPKTVSLDFDLDGNFYIDGKKILTHEVVQLRIFELTLLIITTAAVVTQAAVSVLTYLH